MLIKAVPWSHPEPPCGAQSSQVAQIWPKFLALYPVT
jgi:hypothetical protein